MSKPGVGEGGGWEGEEGGGGVGEAVEEKGERVRGGGWGGGWERRKWKRRGARF